MKNPIFFTVGKFLIIFSLFSIEGFAQKTVVTPKPKPVPQQRPVPEPPDMPETIWGEDTPFEKFIEVDGKVTIGLCVSEGKIRINGWDRNEIRVFVEGGSQAGFKILKRNSSNKPVWLTVLGYDPSKDKAVNQCLFGDNIELDVPRGATINKLNGKGDQVMISIESVAKVVIENPQGDVSLSEIEQGVECKTFEGDITLENSGGGVNLETLEGNILVYGVEPHAIGERLRAKAHNGSIGLQKIGHSVVEASSISGQIRYIGEIQPEGQYNFNNTSGQISLSIPLESSFIARILSQKGKFSYDVPLKILTENDSPVIRNITAQMGEGGTEINLTSVSGRIVVRKIN